MFGGRTHVGGDRKHEMELTYFYMLREQTGKVHISLLPFMWQAAMHGTHVT